MLCGPPPKNGSRAALKVYYIPTTSLARTSITALSYNLAGAGAEWDALARRARCTTRMRAHRSLARNAHQRRNAGVFARERVRARARARARASLMSTAGVRDLARPCRALERWRVGARRAKGTRHVVHTPWIAGSSIAEAKVLPRDSRAVAPPRSPRNGVDDVRRPAATVTAAAAPSAPRAVGRARRSGARRAAPIARASARVGTSTRRAWRPRAREARSRASGRRARPRARSGSDAPRPTTASVERDVLRKSRDEVVQESCSSAAYDRRGRARTAREARRRASGARRGAGRALGGRSCRSSREHAKAKLWLLRLPQRSSRSSGRVRHGRMETSASSRSSRATSSGVSRVRPLGSPRATRESR